MDRGELDEHVAAEVTAHQIAGTYAPENAKGRQPIAPTADLRNRLQTEATKPTAEAAPNRLGDGLQH